MKTVKNIFFFFPVGIGPFNPDLAVTNIKIQGFLKISFFTYSTTLLSTGVLVLGYAISKHAK